MKREEIAELILNKLDKEKNSIGELYKNSSAKIGYFYIDNLLPDELAKKIYNSFPSPDSMKMRKSLREYKYIAAQMDQYDPILEECIYAFQDARIVSFIQDICGIESLYPDKYLYAGGISLMAKGSFLNPHLDNSHEKDRAKWRVLNLLYYISPNWEGCFGGNLEIWPEGPQKKQITIDSTFNRLVVMATHGASWHSVSPIVVDEKRACVSNYYFSDQSLKADDTFHVTSFRGRPEQNFRDVILRADILLRQSIRKIFPKGAVKTDHLYKK
ncbi:2OG-Fe(II) oxygenase [Microbulbifer sp. SAOS-129_SWC]|uniref:2OG-Fe(II) oxygenase n=1 Tax=Microbulbifer sp. SAOS-129_SWC TaxID=3145235 RepID=UPI003218044E